jgi:hypothetical protein
MCCAILIGGIFIVDPRKVVRDDGTHIAIFKKEKPGKELVEMLKVFVDKRILLLTPAIFCGEMASALVSSINGTCFRLFRDSSLRTTVQATTSISGPGASITPYTKSSRS